ncbi:hypothetical protein Q9Q95_13985 [Sphingomonas sp. DG1-23]|uniref:hypothetical protein n=1 Tax=Sphingomonas sp. DG1-23 TaxID=3068316 RepID=UPI00273DBCE0|nr:hypothetical protein [Sphingomonas sp. DG1-23]MDP5280039.1 hypothetical protein [Sphingomonas sp. DG1-23]
MRPAFASLLLLAACGPADSNGEEQQAPIAAAANRAEAVAATPVASPSPAASNPACDTGAPESPCQIVGKWRVTKVYNPANKDPLADEMGMVGSTFTVTANGDVSGTIRWDGPDNGQFDHSDVCTGPYLSPAVTPRPDASRATLAAAIKAWKVDGDASTARHLGCDQGHWALPSGPGGKWFGLLLPMGRQMAFEWFDERIVLAERAD